MEAMAKQKPIQTTTPTSSVSSTGSDTSLLGLNTHHAPKIVDQELSETAHVALEDHSHLHHAKAPVFNANVEIKEKDFMSMVGNRNDLDQIFGQVHAGDFSNLEKGASLFEKTLDLYARNNAFHEEAMITMLLEK